MLSWLGIEVIILQGNHDYLREGHTYFNFVNHIPNIRFLTQMEAFDDDDGPTAFFLPHNKNPSKAWAGLDFSHYDYLFMHQTVKGSIASNGQLMDGEPLPPLNAVKVYSGDIHVPQVIGEVEYVGSPYHVHFGDRFKPRCVLIDRQNKKHDLHFETISRVVLRIKSLRELKSTTWLKAGDQVRLQIELDASEKHEWQRLKREASEILLRREVDLDGVELKLTASTTRLGEQVKSSAGVRALTDPEAILRFVEAEDLGGDALEAGLRVIE